MQIFTPLEYGCIGFAEEAAIQAYGEDALEVYHTRYAVCTQPTVTGDVYMLLLSSSDDSRYYFLCFCCAPVWPSFEAF